MKNFWLLTKTTVISWIDDYAQSMGAALSFYTLFSIAPLLLIVVSIIGLILGKDAAQGEIVGQLQGLMGKESAIAIQALLQNVNKPTEGMLSTIVGFVLLLFGATSVFGELQNALDRIWRAPERIQTSGIWNLIHTRLLSFGMILGVGFISMVSLLVSAGLSAVTKWWAPIFEQSDDKWLFLISGLNTLFSFLITTAMFALIYKLMPRVKIDWKDVLIGSIITSVLFTVGKSLIGIYIGTSAIASGYGAAGSLVVLLIWVYYSAQVFLMGAEFTWVYANIYGSQKINKLYSDEPPI